MRVWRICRKPYADDTLAGRGGLFGSGRWHSRGRPVVYTSQTLSLAALEVLVHVDRDVAPADLVQVEVDLPSSLKIQRVEAAELPKNWRSYPAPVKLQEIGDRWLANGETAVLRVPSSLIPEEFNFVLNPQHADARRIQVIATTKFTYDARLAGPA